MTWLEKTHGVKFELIRHFLARMFDSEMFSTGGQWTKIAVSAFSLAIPGGMLLLDPPYFHKPVAQTVENLRAVAMADQLAILTFVFAITGFLALLAWQSLFPSRRDYLALAGTAGAIATDFRGAVCVGVAAIHCDYGRDELAADRHGASSIHRGRGFAGAYQGVRARGVVQPGVPVYLLCHRGDPGAAHQCAPRRACLRGGRPTSRARSWRYSSWAACSVFSLSTGGMRKSRRCPILAGGRRRSGLSVCTRSLSATAIRSTPRWPRGIAAAAGSVVFAGL